MWKHLQNLMFSKKPVALRQRISVTCAVVRNLYSAQYKIKQNKKFFEGNYVWIFPIKKIMWGKCSFHRPFIIDPRIERELRNTFGLLPSERKSLISGYKESAGVRLPAFESWLHSCPAVRPWVNHLTSLCLSFFIQKVQKIWHLSEI